MTDIVEVLVHYIISYFYLLYYVFSLEVALWFDDRKATRRSKLFFLILLDNLSCILNIKWLGVKALGSSSQQLFKIRVVTSRPHSYFHFYFISIHNYSYFHPPSQLDSTKYDITLISTLIDWRDIMRGINQLPCWGKVSSPCMDAHISCTKRMMLTRGLSFLFWSHMLSVKH